MPEMGEEEMADIIMAEVTRLREVERLAERVVCLQDRVDRGLAAPWKRWQTSLFKRKEAITRLKEALEGVE
jgi:hypothetical protein